MSQTTQILNMKIKLLFNWHFWYDIKYKVECFFKPRQEWLTDVIPDTYCDKVELIPRLLFKCLEHYVEVECKQDHVHDLDHDWSEQIKNKIVTQDYADRLMLRNSELLEAYEYITRGRPSLDERIEKAYPKDLDLDSVFKSVGDSSKHYEYSPSKERSECYKEVDRLETIKCEKDKKYMRVIIKHHQSLWT